MTELREALIEVLSQQLVSVNIQRGAPLYEPHYSGWLRGGGQSVADELLPVIEQYVKERVTLAMRKASRAVESIVSEYPIESPAVQAGIWGDFDQWAMAYAEGLADIDLDDDA